MLRNIFFNWPSAVFGGGFGFILALIISFFMGAGFWPTVFAVAFAFIGGHLLFVAAGLRKIPVGSQALKLWIGARELDAALSEGWQWWWPSPLGSLLVEDCRVKNLDIPLDKVLTHDKVAVTLDVSISYHIGPEGKNPTPQEWAAALNLYTNVTEADFVTQLKQEAAEKFRASASGVHSNKIHEAQDDILNGYDHSQGVIDALRARSRAFGAHVVEVQIANITLPPEIVAAAAQERAEEGQKRAETTERKGIEEAIKGYKDLGLSAVEAARLHTVERGKVRETVQTVNIPGLEAGMKAMGGMIAGALGKGAQDASDKEESK